MKLLKNIILTLVCLILCCIGRFNIANRAFANTPFSYSQISTNDGLPQNDVNDICQDEKGFMWFATNDGICRYDGYEFDIFQDGNNIVGTNFILSLALAADHKLWVGSVNKGLALFDTQNEKILKVYRLTNEPINKIAVDRYNNIYLLVNNSKLLVISQKDSALSILRTIDNVFSISIDREGYFCAVTTDSILKFNSDQTYNKATLQSEGLIKLKFGAGVTTVLVNNKLFRIDEDNSLKLLTNIPIDNYTIASNNDIWITNNDGVHRMHQTPLGYSNPQLIMSSRVWFNKIFVDNSGTVWLGSVRKGLYKFVSSAKLFTIQNRGCNSEVVFGDSRSRLWIGAFSGELDCMGLYNSQDIYPIETQTKPYMITSITEHPVSHRLYMGNLSGIMSTSTKSSDIKFTDHENLTVAQIGNIDQMLPDSSFMWIATYNSGLHLYDVAKDEIVRTINVRVKSDIGSISSNIVRSVFKDKANNLWIATDRGLDFIESSERFKEHPQIVSYSSHDESPIKLSYDYFLPIAQRRNGEIIAGTLGGGVNILSPSKTADTAYVNRIIDVSCGLSNNTIKAIVVDDADNIWVSTNRGINKISNTDDSVTSYSIEDGLQNYEYCDLSSMKLPDGNIIFGGVDGINRFYPDKTVSSGATPLVSFTNLQLQNNDIAIWQHINGHRILDKSIIYTDEILIPYPNNSFALEFTSINSQQQNTQRYRYILEPFDSEYTYTSSAYRIAKYTNIPAGEYRLIVEGSNDGVTWSEPTSMIINIEPSEFLKLPAIVCYMILIVIILYLFLRVVKHRHEVRSEILAAHLEKEYIAKFSKAHMDLVTNISHEFRTPLTLIISPLQQLLEKSYEDKSVRKMLNSIDHNSKLLLRFTNMFLDYSRGNRNRLEVTLKRDDIISLCRSTFEHFESIAEQQEISLEFFSSNSEINMLFDHHQMEEVLYNLLSNAIKHTPKGGIVSLDIDYDNNTTTIRVSDTGQGIPDSMKSSIFERFFSLDDSPNSTGVGLNLTKTLVELHKGTIDFVSQEGSGTTFIVTLPELCAEIEDISDNEHPATMEDENQESALVDDNSATENRSILVVDDDKNIVELLHELLCSKYTVVEAYDGVEALEKSRKFMPDVIISDIRMPRMNGFDLCREIKLDVATSHIPVILLSTRTSSEVQMGGLNAQADAYCAKPFDNKVLMATIKSLISNRRLIIEKYKSSYLLSGGETHTNEEDQLVNQAIEIIEENMASPLFNVEFLCSRLNINYITLNKKIKEMTGHTTNVFIRKVKMRRAAEMLQSKKFTVYEVTYAVGFNDLKCFRANFVKEFGVLPSEFSKQDKE